MSDSVFSKIIKGDLPSTKEYESENILVIHDINPVAPVHLLIITKTPYTNLQSVPIKDLPVLTEVFEVAQSLAAKLKIADNYRIVTNNGAKAGQHVFHLHFHLIGGKKLNHLL